MPESTEAIPDLKTRIQTGLRDGFKTSLKLIKFVLPLYIVVDLLKGSEVINVLGGWFAPVMKLFGLPGEAAFAFMAAFFTNLYAAIAVLAPLKLTPWQVTECGLMMGIAHNLLLEGGVLGSTGTRAGVLTICRLLLAMVAGLLLHWAQLLGGW